MHLLDRIFRELDGLASTADLRAYGLWTTMIEVFARYGSLDRVRRGWYAAPGTPEDQRMAWQLGGRLTCVSALAHHELMPQPSRVHVLLPRHASRRRLSPELLTGVVLHWRRADPPGTPRAVCLDEAWAQAATCTALTAAEQSALRERTAGSL